jgi:hypothetical protein
MFMKTARTWIAALATLATATVLGGAAVDARPGAGSGPPNTAGAALSTDLVPGEEVDPFVGVEGATGTAAMWLNPGLRRICVELETTGFDLVLAHIHAGDRGTNGGVVVNFTPLVEGNTATGCVDVDRSLIRDILRDPDGYYVNVHQGVPDTTAFFQGIRGQLTR